MIHINITQMDYSKKSREELIALCKGNNIKGYSGKKKADIIQLITSKLSGIVHTDVAEIIPKTDVITYVDLFCGIGGFRIGIEEFSKKHPEYVFECVKTADIKKDAIKTYNANFNENNTACDVRTLKNLPYFDILCGGFPCQPFSSAGKQKGLKDEGRGDLIFEVIRICKESKPKILILENVSNIETIDKGQVLQKIIKEFENIGYFITYVKINANKVGLAQDRSRIFIIGSRKSMPQINLHTYQEKTIKDILDLTDKTSNISADFLNKLKILPIEKVIGKSIKDKRGGDNNIHSWDIDFHGKVSANQKILLNKILLERRKKHWTVKKKMPWADGLALSLEDIKTFFNYDTLFEDLEDLVAKKYLVKESHQVTPDDKTKKEYTEIGYNISKGKLSFPISKILHPNEFAPTLTATDSSKLAVCVDTTIRQLNERELKRLCGFPETYIIPPKVNKYDLFGNMVCPPVITEILESLLPQLAKE